MLDAITAARQDVGAPAPRTATEAVEQLRPIVLALCAQTTADPEGYARHFELVGRHLELRARDAVTMQEIADTLSGLLIHRGSDEVTARFTAQRPTAPATPPRPGSPG